MDIETKEMVKAEADTKTMSSTELAEMLHVQKKEINRNIREMFADKIYGGKIPPSLDSRGYVTEYHLPELEAKMFVAKKDINYLEKIVQFWIDKNEIATPKLPQNYLEALKALTTEVEAKQQALLEVKEKQIKIKEDAPKVEYHDKVLDSSSGLTITEIAKMLNMSAVELNKFLSHKGLQYKQNKRWVLYQSYINKGWVIEATWKSKASDKTGCYSKWTQKGKKAIVSMVMEDRAIANMMKRNRNYNF